MCVQFLRVDQFPHYVLGSALRWGHKSQLKAVNVMEEGRGKKKYIKT